VSQKVRAAAAGSVVLAALGAAALWSSGAVRTHTVTAIDYHFHDAHPTPPLAPGDTLRFSNQGRNVHNVTFEGAGYSKDFQPGDEFVIEEIGEFLGGPGSYTFFCAYHKDRGMTGTVVIVSG
jgi:plastocyanin